MLRVSLILMLTAVQLLAGSSRAVYLCVSSDGSVCCLDSGPLSCTCCRHEHDANDAEEASCELEATACESACCRHDEAASSPIEESPSQTGETPLLTTGPCDCDHELILTGQPTRLTRSASVSKIADALQHLDCTPAIAGWPVVECPHGVRWQGPPPLPDVAISVLCIVAIRC